MLSGTKILVVADDEGLTQYLREKLLVDGGYYVTFENNFRLGLESFRENSYEEEKERKKTMLKYWW